MAHARSPDQLRTSSNGDSAQPQEQSPARIAPRCRVEALAPASRVCRHAARRGPVRVRQRAEPRLLSDHVHRLAALRHGERRLGRDRRRRKRGDRGHLAVHGCYIFINDMLYHGGYQRDIY